MAYLALRGSAQVNGVSKLHGEVSRHIFQPLFPSWPQAEVPIGSVTNGIHVPTWDSAGSDALWTKACGADRWRYDRPISDDVRRLSNTDLWQMRTEARREMLVQVRDRYVRQISAEGSSPLDVAGGFKDGVLTQDLPVALPPISVPIYCCTILSGSFACSPIRSGLCSW